MHSEPLQYLILKESVNELMAVARPHERAVIALRAEGFQYGEIAGLLNVDPSTTRMRVYRARHRILRHRPEAYRLLGDRRPGVEKHPSEVIRESTCRGGCRDVEVATDPGDPGQA